MEYKLRWKLLQTGTVVLMVGKHKVGKVWYDSTTAASSKRKWKAVSLLPGINEQGYCGHHDGENKAKESLETITKGWLSSLTMEG